MRLATIFAAAAMMAAGGLAARAEGLPATVQIKEWTVPYEASRPRDPFAVSAEEVWFVGQRTGYLARLNAVTGQFFKHDLPPGSGPHNLIVAKDGGVWFAGNRNGYIGRYDPKTGAVEKVAMPDPAARDPHTLVFDRDQSHIWFTVQGGNFIGRLALDGRQVDLVPVPTKGARPYGIKVGPDGVVYAVLFGTNKLATVDPETLALREHDLPQRDARPRRLEVAAAGLVYYVDYARGTLGRFDVASGAAKEYAMPGGEGARPYGSALDAKGRVWFVETGESPNRFTGFDPETEAFIAAVPVPSGGGAVRHMHYHAASNTIWFGTDANTIGRATLPE